MRALADLGERAQALREYERCRQTLKVGLDVVPSRETQALYEAIRTMPARIERTQPARSTVIPFQPHLGTGSFRYCRTSQRPASRRRPAVPGGRLELPMTIWLSR